MILKTRRSFFKKSFFGTALLVISANKLFATVTPLETIAVLWQDLFPDTQGSSPYISLIFNHSRISLKEKTFLRNGVQWLNEDALSLYKKTYTELSCTQRQEVLRYIAKYVWGESWIEKMLGYILEAKLGDPIYGINKNESGWKWLHHQSGFPRPKEMVL